MAAPAAGSAGNGINLFDVVARGPGSGLPGALAATFKRVEPAAMGALIEPGLFRRLACIFCNDVGGL